MWVLWDGLDRVLMTKGVKGMYIYACDEALREELIRVSKCD